MKRFWKDAAHSADQAAEHVILLDGKPMRLPGGDVLKIASPTLAAAIAEEWRTAGGGVGGAVAASDTPLTQLAGTAQIRIAPNPQPTIDALAQYAESDLLCYRAVEPPALHHRQAQLWQPWLDWAALTYDAPLSVTTGIVHIAQSEASLTALRSAVAGFDAPILAGLGVLVPALGSLVLGLAVAEGRLAAQAAHELGALDELFQAELWGQDKDAIRRRNAVAADVAVATRFIALARAGDPP